MRALAQAVLRGPSPIDAKTRELVAAYVSSRNECAYCTHSHAAVARRLGDARVDDAIAGKLDAFDEKTRSFLAIAEHVRAGIAPLPNALVSAARAAGADDVAIHDVILVAAAFSMFNRYVESTGALTPPADAESYVTNAERLATKGYNV